MTKRKDDPELVAAVRDLMMIGQRLYHRYADDVSPYRADEMERLYLRLEPIAQPIIDRNPFGYGDRHLKFIGSPTPDRMTITPPRYRARNGGQ